jgi:hypothetical protein
MCLLAVGAVRYEPVSLLFGQYQGDLGKKQRAGGQKCQKDLQHSHFSNIALIRYQGGTGSAHCRNTERHLANWEGKLRKVSLGDARHGEGPLVGRGNRTGRLNAHHNVVSPGQDL